jgi:hypothetical protein
MSVMMGKHFPEVKLLVSERVKNLLGKVIADNLGFFTPELDVHVLLLAQAIRTIASTW